MKFSIHWLHMLEFAIIAASIEFIARASQSLTLQVFSYINLYIFFSFILNFFEESTLKYFAPFVSKSKTNKYIIQIFSIIISLAIVFLMVTLILQILEEQISNLKHL